VIERVFDSPLRCREYQVSSSRSGFVYSQTLSCMIPNEADTISCIPMGIHTRAIRRSQLDLDHLLALQRGDWTVLQVLVR
jgi:hypothetical protein